MTRVFVCCLVFALLSLLLLLVFPFSATRAYADRYANHASLAGFIVSIIGFALTVWTLRDGIRANKKAQAEIKAEVRKVRQEAKQWIVKIRIKSVQDSCEQGSFFLDEARYAMRTNQWLRVAEKVSDARKVAMRLLNSSDLATSEATSLRKIVEDLQTTVSFIERYRLGEKSKPGLPPEKAAPLDSLSDALETIQSRLHRQILEVPDAD